MDDQARWTVLERVFHAALALEPDARAEYVRTQCGSDEELLQRVNSLLGHDSGLGPERAFIMSAAPCIGPYQVISKLGAGGMGEVYLARDSRLGRQVALKILPGRFARDHERKQRLVREAQAAAALTHPNIAAVYDVGTEGELAYIVMEYVQGKPLDRLIPHEGLKLTEILKYATQIAEALAAAHRAGIIHRDLKPANVLIANSGDAKVVDFGLAKQVRAAAESATLTQEGVIVGTVAYMSPEQAEGKPVDHRSDIFSFGSLLYELATGARAFHRGSNASTIAAILREEPDPSKGLPSELEPIIRKCLRKDPALRFQTADDLKLALEEARRKSDSNALVGQRREKWGHFKGPAFVIGVVTVVLAGAIWLLLLKTSPPLSDFVPMPLTSYPGTENSPSFSPDGTQVAFSWCRASDIDCRVYIKQIGVEPPSRLTQSSAPEFSPVWSPDGQRIALMRRESPARLAVVVIPQRGGPERVVEEVNSPVESGDRLMSWTPDSRWLAIVEMVQDRSELFLVSIENGEKRQLVAPPAESGGDGHPAFSPDGRTLAFVREATTSDLYLLRLDDRYRPVREPEKVPTDQPFSWAPAWTPDGRELVFSSGTLTDFGLWRTVAAKGAKPHRLAFLSDDASWPAISRQANRLAYTLDRSDTNIWRIDLHGARRQPAAAVQFISSTRNEIMPAFSPDGRHIAFVSDRSGALEIWVCDRDGSNVMQVTSLGGATVFGPRWSPDGRMLAFSVRQKGLDEVYIVSVTGGVPRRVTATVQGSTWPSWSHDGRALYYRKSDQVFRVNLNSLDATQITHGGGDMPIESADGKYLYYHKGWPNALSIWRMPVEGGNEAKVVDSTHSIHPFGGWAVGPDGVYYFVHLPGGQERNDLRMYEFATGKTKTIVTVTHALNAWMSVSPDDRTILYAQVDAEGRDLMLVENFR